jgi:hypothetical protein
MVCTCILVLEAIDLHPNRLNQLLKEHMYQYRNKMEMGTDRNIQN